MMSRQIVDDCKRLEGMMATANKQEKQRKRHLRTIAKQRTRCDTLAKECKEYSKEVTNLKKRNQILEADCKDYSMEVKRLRLK